MAKIKSGVWFAIAGAAVIGFVIYKFAAIKNATKFLRYKISSLKASNFSLLDFKLTFNLEILNDSSESFEFKNFVGKVSYKATTIANFYTSESKRVNVQAKSSVKIPMSLTVKYDSLVNVLTSFLYLKNNTSVFTSPFLIQGVITIGSVQIPVNQSISL